MDKNSKKQNETLIQMLTLLMIFVLFVISAFINEILGMLMFGGLITYAMLGNHTYKVEHKAYEEIMQSKRELLNYDGASTKQKEKEDVKSHMKKRHLVAITLMFFAMSFGAYVSVELGMIIFGVIIFYILYVSD